MRINNITLNYFEFNKKLYTFVLKFKTGRKL